MRLYKFVLAVLLCMPVLASCSAIGGTGPTEPINLACLDDEDRLERIERDDKSRYWQVELTSYSRQSNVVDVGIRLTNLDSVSHVPPTNDLGNYELIGYLARDVNPTSFSNRRFFSDVPPCGSISTEISFIVPPDAQFEYLLFGRSFSRAFADLVYLGIE